MICLFSTDADIEDNLESDASRSRLTDNSNSVNASTLGRAPISDINETDKISMGSASTNSLDITNMKDINDRPADVRSTHHIDDRKDSGIDSVADSLSTLSLTGQDGTKSNGSSWGGGGSSSSSSTGVIAGSDECMAEHTGSVMATSTVSAETDEGKYNNIRCEQSIGDEFCLYILFYIYIFFLSWNDFPGRVFCI